MCRHCQLLEVRSQSRPVLQQGFRRDQHTVGVQDGNEFKEYRFGKINMNCAGYSSCTITNVLKGSCGLDFNLDLTSGSCSTLFGS